MFSSRRITTLGGSKFQDNFSVEFSGDSTENNERMATSDTYASTLAGDWSVSAWIKPEDGRPAALDKIMGSLNSSNQDYFYVGITTAGKLETYFKSNGDAMSETKEGDVVFADGASDWVHCIWTAKAQTASTGFTWYYNGASAGAMASDESGDTSAVNWAAFATDINPFISGLNSNGSLNGSFEGNISELAIYNVQLTANDAATIYNSREAFDHKNWSKAQNVAGWWRFGDGNENGQGTTIYDLSGNGNNGTLTNTDAGDIEGDTP